MATGAGSRRTLNAILVAVACMALGAVLLGRGLLVGVAGAQTTTPTTDSSVVDTTTTSAAVTTTTAEPPPTTVAEETETSQAVETTSGASSSDGAADDAASSSITTAVEEEAAAADESAPATLQSSTTAPPAVARTPVPSITTTSAAVPSSAASSNGTATSGTGATQPADDSQERLRLVMATLVVVGLIIGLLTWRYWRYSDPKRGLAPSRARLPVLRPQSAGEVLEPTTAPPTLEATALDGAAVAGAAMLVPSAAASGSAWSPTVSDDLAVRGLGRAPDDRTVVATEDPTDPGGWTLPDREPVGSD